MPLASLERGLDVDLHNIEITRCFKGEQSSQLVQRASEKLGRRFLVPQYRHLGFNKRMIDYGEAGQAWLNHARENT
jgi:hypothetical protein